MAQGFIFRQDGTIESVEVDTVSDVRSVMGGEALDRYNFVMQRFAVYGLRTSDPHRQNTTLDWFISAATVGDGGRTVVGFEEGVTRSFGPRVLYSTEKEQIFKALNGFFSGDALVTGMTGSTGRLDGKTFEDILDLPDLVKTLVGNLK